ncbi:MAG: hypothetical protein JWP20_745 [Roseomonas sp.]|nr:hypothetical protein [Roseomonas sp.]
MNVLPHGPAASPPAPRGRGAAVWPKVSLHLPLRDAPPELVRRTLDSLAALDYPELEVLVVDTHTTEPGLWEAVAEHCARLGPQFRFFHLGPWPGFRAGALNFALRETAADATLVGILKAGEVVRHRWLRRMVPLFRDPSLALAQSPLEALPLEPTHLDQLAQAERETRQGPQDALLPLNALPLLRLAALRQAGGWDESSLCPEAAPGVTLLRHGWETTLAPQPMGRALAQDTFPAWRSRRHRQVAGTTLALRGVLAPGRAFTLQQKRGLLRIAAPALADAAALAGVAASLACSAMALREGVETRLPFWLLPLLLVLALLPVLRAGGHGGLAALGSMALSWRMGRAAWQGLLGIRAPHAGGVRMETMLLAVLWAAALAVVLARPWNQSGTLLWAGLLVLQSLPGLATLAVAALPGRQPTGRGAGFGFRRHATGSW